MMIKQFILCLLAAFLLSGCFSVIFRTYNVEINATQQSTVDFSATVHTTVEKEYEVKQDTEIDVTKPRFGGVF